MKAAQEARAQKTEIVKLESFNIFGNKRKEGTLKFDFKNSLLICGSGKAFKVINDYEYTYKIQKTQIKASGGIEGLFKFVNEINVKDSPFNPGTVEMFIEL